MDGKAILKTNQEQAVASWINYLNQIRLDRLMEALNQQDKNWSDAMITIEIALSKIKEDIVTRNRGGEKGMHGFIAEIAECGIGNARQQIEGEAATHVWVNDNGPVDIMRGAQAIQQKFVQSGGHLSLQAVRMHLKAYPDFIKDGGCYQIPKDHYDKILYYLSIPEDAANKMPTANGDFSLKQWKEVHAFFADGSVDIQHLEPSILEYPEVQSATYEATFDKEKEHLAQRDQECRDAAYQESKPSLAEGAKATAISAAIEGGTALCMAIVQKRKSGKKLKDFTEEDWKQIAGEAGTGTVKGAIRGGSIYVLTNFTATPAAVASAVTTASFGVAEQAHLYRTGAIGEQEFIEHSETLCMDAAVSAISSLAGQMLIPVPVLGAVIGNTIGTLLYQIGKDSLTKKEQAIFAGYISEINVLDQQLEEAYRNSIDQMNAAFSAYIDVLAVAFVPDVMKALHGSAELAKTMGVPTEEILDTREKVFSYFMD